MIETQARTFDRRRTPRTPLTRACKVLHAPTGRYWPAVSWDLSSTGMLLGIDSPRELTPGDSLEVYIAWSNKPLLRSEEKIIAEVKRVLPRTDGRQLVGVEFKAALPATKLASKAA